VAVKVTVRPEPAPAWDALWRWLLEEPNKESRPAVVTSEAEAPAETPSQETPNGTT
jgi:hypothetical protein